MKEKSKLNAKKIMQDFVREEESPSSRKGRFRINSPFEDAMKKILKAKPEPKRRPKKD